MNYQVHIKQLPQAHVVTKRMHTTLAKIGDAMTATLATIAAEVTPHGAARGVPFAIYHNEPFKPDDVDVELGIPIAQGASVPSAAGAIKELPGGPVAYTVHVGSYESISGAYAALFGWLAQHGMRANGAPREVYVLGPGQGSKPEEYRTEIAVPVE